MAAAPWERYTYGDEDYRAGLLKAMTPGEYNLLDPVGRRTLLTQFEQQQQQQQQQSSTVGTIPEHYVPVLLSLAVSLMKSGWEKISSEHTKSESSIARNNSVSHYGLGSRRTCQILGTTQNTAHVKNAHIWPHDNSEALVLVDLQPSDIDDPRNILRLHEDIEATVACHSFYSGTSKSPRKKLADGRPVYRSRNKCPGLDGVCFRQRGPG